MNGDMGGQSASGLYLTPQNAGGPPGYTMGIVLTRWRRKKECPFREEKGIPPVLGGNEKRQQPARGNASCAALMPDCFGILCVRDSRLKARLSSRPPLFARVNASRTAFCRSGSVTATCRLTVLIAVPFLATYLGS